MVLVAGVVLAGPYLFDKPAVVSRIRGRHNESSRKFSTDIAWDDLAGTLSSILLQTNRYHVLCMHHVESFGRTPYRGCSTRVHRDEIYHMLNPEIVELRGNQVSVQEKSIRTTSLVEKTRHECVFVKWMDLSLNNLTAAICGPPAISLQLAIDEFH